MKRIHIVGSGPRTGTTFLAEMMIACFAIDVHTEHEDSIYTWLPYVGDIFLTKKPRDILVIEPVLRIMRNLYVIYMARDPRDMIVSKHEKDPDRYWANLKFWKTYTFLNNFFRFFRKPMSGVELSGPVFFIVKNLLGNCFTLFF